MSSYTNVDSSQSSWYEALSDVDCSRRVSLRESDGPSSVRGGNIAGVALD